MKLSIEGFNQRYALSLVKTVPNRDSEKIIRIDCTDLVILRWFVDFYPKMEKINSDGQEYAWLSYKKLHEDLPILDISKRSVAERLKKLVEFEILDYKIIHEAGNMTYYSFGKNYDNLITDDSQMQSNAGFAAQTAMVNESDNDGGLLLKQHSLCCSNSNNKSIINKSINISTSKSNKLDLSVDTGSEEPSDVSYEQNEFIHNENPVGVSCYEEENKQNITAHAGEDAGDETVTANSMPDIVDTSEEQSDVDKLNAMKKFKGTPKPAKPKKTTPFQKCIKMIYDSNNSDEVKHSLIEFLKSLSQYRTITESAFEIILENLDKAVAECPHPNDEGLMNYLKLHVIKSSHGKGYRDLYPIKSYELVQLVSDYRGTKLGQSANNSFDTAKSIIYDENDPNHKLATNPDGSPMIF